MAKQFITERQLQAIRAWVKEHVTPGMQSDIAENNRQHPPGQGPHVLGAYHEHACPKCRTATTGTGLSICPRHERRE